MRTEGEIIDRIKAERQRRREHWKRNPAIRQRHKSVVIKTLKWVLEEK